MRRGAVVGVLVETASIADAAEIARVHVETWRAAYRGIMSSEFLAGLDVATREEQWRNWIELPERRTLIAKQGGALLGFCLTGPARDPDANDATFEIYALNVGEAHWRSGCGRALLERAIDDAADDGAAQLTLWVLEQNQRARLFYEKLGFSPDGVSKIVQMGGVPLNELRYRRKLA
ncbi:MAG TPA: GNAT family N-acetyltransferase [Polyangiaceae bacterium]|nr:GNAT family N-acetyltransferase [Polyangiaceae bacterium]